LKDLEQKHEQLKLVTLAMWQMLKSHTGLTDNDLKKFIREVITVLLMSRPGKNV